jgi:hypothetical protein
MAAISTAVEHVSIPDIPVPASRVGLGTWAMGGMALWGARQPSELEPLHDVMGWHLDVEALHDIDDIIRDAVHDPVGPEFMAPPT